MRPVYDVFHEPFKKMYQGTIIKYDFFPQNFQTVHIPTEIPI